VEGDRGRYRYGALTVQIPVDWLVTSPGGRLDHCHLTVRAARMPAAALLTGLGEAVRYNCPARAAQWRASGLARGWLPLSMT